MLKQIHIYQIWFPTSDKCYIGQTNNIQERMLSHLDSKFLVGNALRKYNNWTISILHTCKTRDESNRIEIEEIRNFNSIAPNGYNLTRGGEGGDTFTDNPNKEIIRERDRKASTGRFPTDETKKKMRSAAKERKLSESTKEKIRKARQGTHASKETINKMKKSQQGKNNGFYGKLHSSETKEKMRQAKLGVKRKPFSKEYRVKLQIGQLKRRIREMEPNTIL